MKRTLYPLMGILLLCCTSCDRVRQYFQKMPQEESQVKRDKSVGQLEFTRVFYCSPDSSVTTEADLPILNGSALGDSIFTYLEEEFPGLTDVYIEGSADLEKAFQRMGQSLFKNINMQKEELRAEYEKEDIPEYMLAWTLEKHVTIACDMPRYITYLDNMSEYTGGAHGMGYSIGTTFDKTTGQRIDSSILKDVDDPAFRSLFLKKLLKYFTDNDEGNEESTLEDYLLVDVDAVVLSNISLTNNSIVVRYQPYEIAPYAAGMPNVELPFEQVKPYLSQKGLALIGE